MVLYTERANIISIIYMFDRNQIHYFSNRLFTTATTSSGSFELPWYWFYFCSPPAMKPLFFFIRSCLRMKNLAAICSTVLVGNTSAWTFFQSEPHFLADSFSLVMSSRVHFW